MGTAAVQGELWGARARDWAERAEPTTRGLWEAMLEAAEVRLGTRLLDLGCGAGGAAQVATDLGAKVTGLDASENLIAIARERLQEGDFRVGDLESLPFPDGSFDLVFAANSLQFVGDKSAALGEVKRVLAPEGKFVVGMWGENERCQMAHVFKALSDLVAHEPPKEPTLTVRDNLAGLLTVNGFEIEQEGEVECVFEFESPEEGWKGIRSAGMMVGAARAVGEERLEEAVVASLRPFQDETGRTKLSNWFRFMVAR